MSLVGFFSAGPRFGLQSRVRGYERWSYLVKVDSDFNVHMPCPRESSIEQKSRLAGRVHNSANVDFKKFSLFLKF